MRWFRNRCNLRVYFILFPLFMNKNLRLQLLLLTLLGTASAAQAQANLVHGIVAGINLGRMAARGSAADKSVEAVEYRNRSFPTKRTVPEMLTGAASSQILFLEAQLDLCKAALFADSTGVVCPASRQNTLRTMQAQIGQVQSSWPQKYYRQEMAFYMAEDVRRQLVAARANPAK